MVDGVGQPLAGEEMAGDSMGDVGVPAEVRGRLLADNGGDGAVGYADSAGFSRRSTRARL